MLSRSRAKEIIEEVLDEHDLDGDIAEEILTKLKDDGGSVTVSLATDDDDVATEDEDE